MNRSDAESERPDVPLVLRGVAAARTDVVRAFVRASGSPIPSGNWWELSDPTAADAEPPEGVAVSVARSADVVELVLLIVADHQTTAMAIGLVDQLVALLRRSDAQLVCSSVNDPAARVALVSAGFVAVPGKDPDRSGLLVLQL